MRANAMATTDYGDPGVRAPEGLIASHPQPLGAEPPGLRLPPGHALMLSGRRDGSMRPVESRCT